MGVYPQFFVGLCFWVCVSGLRSSSLGVLTFAMTISPHSFDILTDLMWHSGFNWSVN